MAQSNQELAGKLANTGAPTTGLSFQNEVARWFKTNQKRMITLAGSQKEANKFVVTLLHVASRTPQLLQCEMDTVGACLIQSAALNLYPGPLSECAYVPFRNRKKGVMEAQFIPQYQGLAKLAFNSRILRSIATGVVYSMDDFDWMLGSDAFVKHKPAMNQDRGERICAYASLETAQGRIVVVKDMKFIEFIRARSRAKDSGPWVTDYDAMCEKTVLKQALKTLPKSPELAQAIEVDNAVESGKDLPSQIFDVDFQVSDEGTGEEKSSE